MGTSVGKLVGRHDELARLMALVGGGGVALVSGEAGIGKSALLRGLAERAAAEGAVVMAGAAYEGGLMPTLGPWVEALEGALPAAAGGPLGAGEARHRLFDAVTTRLREQAGERPLVVLLDDLHWADPDTLDLFGYAARFCARRRQLLVGAYRQPEPSLEGNQPLADLVTTLLRRDDCLRVPLRPLDLDGAAALLGQLAGAPLPQGLVRALCDESAGNPFYLLELARHLLEEQKIVRRDAGFSFDASVEALAIPAGVRAVLARRLQRLSPDARATLARAAAFTGGFSLRVLAAGSDLSEERLLDALDEARGAGLLHASADGRWTFAHAIVRRALVDDLLPERRARLHRAAAEAVAAVEPAAHAELAALYHASRLVPGAEAGLPHALAAARAARAVGALEHAVALLRLARDLAPAEATAPGPGRREALQALATAEAEALRFSDAVTSARAALDAMAEAGDPPAARADLLARVAGLLRGGGAPPAQVQELVAPGLALVGSERGLSWARLMLLRDRVDPIVDGPIYVGRFVPPEPAAIALLREQGDEDDFAATLDPYQARTRAETEAFIARSDGFLSRAAALRAQAVLTRDWFFRHHDLRAAVAHGQKVLADGERLGQIPAQAVALSMLGCAQAGLGDLAGAERSLRRLQETAERLGPHHRMQQVAPHATRAMIGYFVGCDWQQVVAPLRKLATDPATLRTPLGLVSCAVSALALSQMDERAEAERLLTPLARAHQEGGPDMIDWGPSRSCAAAAIWHLRLEALAPSYRALALDPRGEAAGAGPFDCRELIVARMSALLGDLAEARAWFARARPVLADRGLLPACALADLDEALTLERLAPAEHEAARALAAAALAACEQLGLPPWIARARDALARLTPAAPAPPDGLTAREVDILRRLAAGQANKEIAAACDISVATVERHIANIYSKIGVRGRARATAYALHHKL